MPQGIWKDQVQAGKSVASSSTRVSQVAQKVTGEITMSVDAAKEVIKMFVKTQNKTLLLKEEVTSTELISCLQDCIDSQTDGFSLVSSVSPSPEKPQPSRRGYMAIQMMGEMPEADLPLIDPFVDDEKVWIMIDEGCKLHLSW